MRFPTDQDLAAVLSGEKRMVWKSHHEESPSTARVCVLASSFNPLHRGHLEMASLAAKETGKPVRFELCVKNADKPQLKLAAVWSLLGQDFEGHDVAITSASTFAAKLAIFAEPIFLVGVDTLLRIADRRFYQNSILQRDAAIGSIAKQGGSFYVFGRTMGQGDFQCLGDLDIPSELRRICREIPVESFRVDISSTQIRENPELETRIPLDSDPSSANKLLEKGDLEGEKGR